MLKKHLIFGVFLFSFYANLNAQSGFHFLDKHQKKQQIRFRLINNLVIIPLKINGLELSFILDTGVDKTILFDRNYNDSLVLKNIEKINLRGLGNGKAVTALFSKNNLFKIKNLISFNEAIYIILRDNFNISSRMGTTIHGVIGYRLFKNFIVKINYRSKKITFYNPKYYHYKNCKKCETFPLEFHRNKPYVNISIQLDSIGTKKTPVKMLLDTGGSDAVWLFEHTKKEIQTPQRFFTDVLGEGFSGTVIGNRSRIPAIFLGKYKLKAPTVSFLDTLSSFNARQFKKRNGSIGGEVLRRFLVKIDYPNKKITLKKNSNFKDSFNYNMSGLNVIYNGLVLVREERRVSDLTSDDFGKSANTNVIKIVTSYQYKFKPSYKIEYVTKDSPAAKAGVLAGDILVKLNGKWAYQLKLKDITNTFSERDKKRIRLTVNRNGKTLKFEFRLEKKI